MKPTFTSVVLALGMFFAGTAAHAQAFIGAGVSNNSYDYSDLDNSNGHKFFGGYYLRNGVFIEVAHLNLGDTEADGTTIGLEVSGFAAYVGFRSEAGTGFEGIGKIGLYSFDTDLLSSGSSVATESSNGLAWSIGFAYAFNKTFAMRGELEQFVAVEDFADDNSITGFSLGIELRF